MNCSESGDKVKKINGTISIVIPVYNAEKYIAGCLDSIKKQKYPNWEVILIDDGSTDNSFMVCCQYAAHDRRIKVVRNREKGVSGARNEGISMAKGEWVTFVDSDDTVTENYCSIIYAAPKNGIDILLFGYSEMGNNIDMAKENTANSISKLKKINLNSENKSMILRKLLLFDRPEGFSRVSLSQVWAKAYRHDFIVKNKLGFAEGVIKGEDLLFNARAFSAAQSLLLCNAAIYSYRRGGGWKDTGSTTYRHKPGIAKSYEIFAHTFIDIVNKDESLKSAFSFYCLNAMVDIMSSDFFHRDNKQGRTKERKRFKVIFSNGIYRSAWRNKDQGIQRRKLNFIKRFGICLAIHQHYYLTKFLYLVRNYAKK